MSIKVARIHQNEGVRDARARPFAVDEFAVVVEHNAHHQ